MFFSFSEDFALLPPIQHGRAISIERKFHLDKTYNPT